MDLPKRSALALSFIMLAPLIVALSAVAPSAVAQVRNSAENSPTGPAVPRRPLGIYAKDDISSDIARLKAKGKATDPASLNDYFINLFQSVLKDPAISGLEIQIHWGTVNPQSPGINGDYVWDYLDYAFDQVKLWNSEHQTSPPKTVMLIVTPGFQSPEWLLHELPSCDGLFQTPPSAPMDDCGRVTFDGFIEDADSNQFPLPWNKHYNDEWKRFLQKLSGKYLGRTEFVSISVAGPTAASAEMIVPNSDNLPLQKQFSNGIFGIPAITANNMWISLLEFRYPKQPDYWATDEAFIDAWKKAIDLYGSIFPGITLVANTGSGLPNFGTPGYENPPPGFEGECGNKTMDCAAEATILSYFAEAGTAPSNAKSSQTSGMEAFRAENPDLGAVGVKFLSLDTEGFTSPSAQILGGMEFNTTFSKNTLKEGCISEFPTATCKIQAGCKDQGCIRVECIPDDSLVPGVTAAQIAKYKTLQNVPAEDLIPPEQALYNVVNGFFMNSLGGGGDFGGALGGAPLNYMEIYAPDIVYAENNCTRKAKVWKNAGMTLIFERVSAEELLMQANRTLLRIAEPEPGTPPGDSPCVVTPDSAAGQGSQGKPVQSPDGTKQ
jgi:hypothetical protein